MNRVAVVVLNYKGIDDTVACLASLSEQTYKDFRIVVVENGSGDGSAKQLKRLQPTYGEKLHCIYNSKNLGFTGGVNTGIRWALKRNFEYVALLNNDAIAKPDWLEQLVHTATKKQAGMTTSLLLHEHGDTIDSTGDWYSKWGLPFPRNRGDQASQAPESQFVFGATGGATLYSVKMLQDIGLFDEDLFAYYEDTDICFRAQLAGWKVFYEKSAIAYHKQGATSKKMASGFTVYQTFKNLPFIFIRNVPLQFLLPIGIRFFAAYWLMLGKAVLRGQGISSLKGALVSLLYTPKKLVERRSIQSKKKVSPAYIKSLLWDDLPPDQTGLRKVRSLFLGK